MEPSHHTLIIGCGSIGERHLRCFLASGRSAVSGCEPNAVLRGRMEESYGVRMYADVDEALGCGHYTAAVICVPAPLHIPLAVKLLRAQGLHLLIEKPLAVTADGVDELMVLLEGTVPAVYSAVAYVYRSMPWIVDAAAFLAGGALGAVHHGSIISGQHFPTFRPAYRETYYTRHDQGGGAIQDALTHLVNAVEFLLGPCSRVYCDAAHQSLPGVEVEDTVNLSARHGGALVVYAMNQFQAPNEIDMQFHGELGSLRIQVHERRWGVLLRGETEWQWQVTPSLERDELFTIQAGRFLDGCEGRAHSQMCSVAEALQTLKVNQAALESAANQRVISIV